MAQRPHLRWADGLWRGYAILDVTPSAMQADWFGVATITERTTRESFLKGFRSAAGQPHLVEVGSPAAPPTDVAEPA